MKTGANTTGWAIAEDKTVYAVFEFHADAREFLESSHRVGRFSGIEWPVPVSVTVIRKDTP